MPTLERFKASEVSLSGSQAILRPTEPASPISPSTTFELGDGEWQLASDQVLLTPETLNSTTEELGFAAGIDECELDALLQQLQVALAEASSEPVSAEEMIEDGRIYLSVSAGEQCIATVQTSGRIENGFVQSPDERWIPPDFSSLSNPMAENEIRRRNVRATASGLEPIVGSESSSENSQEQDPPAGGTEEDAPEKEPGVFFTDDNGRSQKPRTIVFGKSGASRLSWTGWGTETARATGKFRENDCDPSCAEGKVIESRARITLSEVAECNGVDQYTKGVLRLTYADGKKYEGDLTGSLCLSTRAVE